MTLQKRTMSIRTSLPGSTHINITKMETKGSPLSLLDRLNLCLDAELVDQIMNLVHYPHQLGLPRPLDSLSVYAIACMVLQSKRLLAVNKSSVVSAGLPIQRLLMRLQPQIRLPVIGVMQRLIPRWHQCPPQLPGKLQVIKQIFSTFEKGQSVFRQLTSPITLPPRLLRNHFKLLWLAYASSKHKNKNYNTPQKSTSLFKALLTVFLGEYLLSLPQELINKHLKKVFPLEIQHQSYNCLQILDKAFGEVLALRNVKRNHITICEHLLSPDLSDRLTDDFFKLLSSKQRWLDCRQVNQALLVETDKNYTPMSIPLDLQPGVAPITERICFSDSFTEVQQGDSNLDNLNMMERQEKKIMDVDSAQSIVQSSASWERQFQEEAKSYEVSVSLSVEGSFAKRVIPTRNRIEALKWAHQALHHKQTNLTEFNRVYTQLFGEQFGEFQKRYVAILSKIIQKYCPECSGVEGQCQKIMNMFLAMVHAICSNKEENQIKEIFKYYSNLTCFLCIATFIINYIYKISSSYSIEIVQAFGLEIRQAFIPINWICKNMNLLQVIKDYLYDIQGRMLLVDLWKKGCGFELLQKIKERKVTYLDKALEQRMNKHLLIRVNQLCQEDHVRAGKVTNIVTEIMEHRSIILQYNNLSTIVLGAYAVSNRTDSLSIEEAKNKWRAIGRYVSEELVAKNYQGCPVTFDVFVKEVLLPEVSFLSHDICKEARYFCSSANSKKTEIFQEHVMTKKFYIMGEMQSFRFQMNESGRSKVGDKSKKKGKYE